MPHYTESLSDDLRDWALAQPMFFIASAPLSGRHVNLSPKGLVSSTFHVFDASHAAYMDTMGSGVETISHIYENGRVTIMFCSFEAKPRIMRLFCSGRVVEKTNPAFQDTLKRMGKTALPGTRAVILLDIWKVQTSCGYGVPLLNKESELENGTEATFFHDRPTLKHSLAKDEKKGRTDAYMRDNNSRSLDGLFGLRHARRMKGENLMLADVLTWVGRQLSHGPAIVFGVVVGLLVAQYMAVLNVGLGGARNMVLGLA